MRDGQRGKLYAAETEAFREPEPALTIEECEALLAKWGSSEGLRERYPRAGASCQVFAARKGTHDAYFSAFHTKGHKFIGPSIVLPGWACNKRTLLHEWAHHLVRPDGGRAPHGWEYVECYLYLLRVFLGRGVEERLKACCKTHRVRFKPKRKLSDEQLAAARARMAALNAGRRVAVAAKTEPEPPRERGPIMLVLFEDGHPVRTWSASGLDGLGRECAPLPPSYGMRNASCPGHAGGSALVSGVRRGLEDAEALRDGRDPERPSEAAMRMMAEAEASGA